MKKNQSYRILHATIISLCVCISVDDLEMEFVAALEAQQNILDTSRSNENYNSTLVEGGGAGAGIAVGLSTAANVIGNGAGMLPKMEQKKRWKNWGWKYSPGGKPSSIEEEPDSPKQSNSAVSSKTNSPKQHGGNQTAASCKTPSSPFVSPSKLPPTGSSSSSLSHSGSNGNNINNGKSNHRIENRQSAGARLCQMFDNSMDESDDELQALLVNGRPASIHVISSRQNLIGNEV